VEFKKRADTHLCIIHGVSCSAAEARAWGAGRALNSRELASVLTAAIEIVVSAYQRNYRRVLDTLQIRGTTILWENDLPSLMTKRASEVPLHALIPVIDTLHGCTASHSMVAPSPV